MRYETARGRGGKSYEAACAWGRVWINSSGRKRTETKDNQRVGDGITILTVMGTDSIEREEGGWRGGTKIQKTSR